MVFQKKLGKRSQCKHRDAQGQFTHCKIIHRYYYTQVKLQRMGLMDENYCWRCQKEMGTFIHLLWDCSFVSPFWAKVVKNIGEWSHKPLPESCQLCLLGDRSLMPPGISKHKFGLLLTGFITGSNIVCCHQKSLIKSAFEEWSKVMTDIVSFELSMTRPKGSHGKSGLISVHKERSLI